VRPDTFHERVTASLDRWKMIPHDARRIGIAVSGGADSVALLRFFHALANQTGFELVVLHVNHQLRGAESDADARFVSNLAETLNIPCEVAELPLAGNENLEQEARDLRRAWFRNRMRALNLDRVALGHTASDQAETVLYRFLRGAATAGLSAIRPVTDDGLIRPFIACTRDEVREQLAPGDWRDDSSNRDPAFDRNRIRQQLLPYLRDNWNPQIENALSTTAEWAQDEEAYWRTIVHNLAQEHLSAPYGESAQICTTEALNALPVAAARRLIRHAIEQIRGDLRSIEFAHVERIRALAAQPEGAGRLQIPGVDIMRSFGWLRFATPNAYSGERHFSAKVTVPGEIRLPESSSVLIIREVLPKPASESLYNEMLRYVDGDRLPGSIELRTWQPGDQFRPVGKRSEVKLKTLFQEAKIPLWERRTWPVLAIGDSIVWTRNFGAAADFAAGPDTSRPMSITEQVNNRNQDPGPVRL
jgi:tRNA(Ile)-lysidine synthase